ncbi:MAG TPA: HAMP domain-containing sensor histidine kinase [Polyangiaceae bacterium]|nr:HAMP domain-containing sensor histidine kinase [Polyangiaceae bacterium]
MRRWREVVLRRGLLVRVFLHGLLLLAGSGAALLVVGKLFFEPAMQRDVAPFNAWVVARACELRDDRAALGRELAFYRERLRLQLTLYTAADAPLATNVEPPFGPAPAAERGALARGEVLALAPGAVFAAGCFDPGGRLVAYGVGLRSPPRFALAGSTAIFFAVLGALALASVPLARSVSAPLERLSAAARAFGRGDLRARAGLRRRDEIGDLAVAFDEMADRIEALLRAEKELLANVSHELRTPLSRTRVVLELADAGDADAARAYLPEIAHDLGELERIVEDVMTAARLDLAAGRAGAGAPPLHLREVPFGGLLDAAASKFRETRPDRRLVVEAAPGLPTVLADPVLVRRALDNLLDNAGKYSSPPSAVELRARPEGGLVVVEVRDAGIGIDEADLPRLFAPFFRTDRSRARETGGIGLGLALTRRIVEAHGGAVRVESRPGVGTTVTLTLPAAPAP